MKPSRQLIVGNWKMNGLSSQCGPLVRTVCQGAAGLEADVVLCPPAVVLPTVIGAISGGVATGAQDCHCEARGAFTGDIAPEMIADLGARYVIVGHSERRAQHGETSELVAKKAAAAIRAGLIPIICVGESLAVRGAGHAEAAVAAELMASLPDEGDSHTIVVAYEPLWAIGTGKICNPADIAAMHGTLRQALRDKSPALAHCRILYGGSVKADNAEESLSARDVDGVLVGGASLEAASFLAIIEAAHKIAVGQMAETR